MKDGIYASLDIGTTSIKVIIAEVLNGKLSIIGVGNERSEGLDRGMIVDIEKTSQAIKAAVAQAAERSGTEINELIVGVPAYDVRVERCYGSVAVAGEDQEITAEDVRAVVDRALSSMSLDGREVISLTADDFVVDGFEGVRDPRGMIGNRLEMNGHLNTVSRSIIHNIKKSVQAAGLDIDSFALLPESMSALVLSDEERAFGTIVLDLGGGQTTAAAIHDQRLKFTAAIPEGGQHVTQDISIVLNASLKNAERLKREMGQAYYELANPERSVQVDVVGQKEPITVKESYLAEIIEARLVQIFEQIKEQLDTVEALSLPGGIVLSGGGASIFGVERLAESVFNVPVRLYIPDYMGVRYPTFTHAISLTVDRARQDELTEVINQAMTAEVAETSHVADEVVQDASPASEDVASSEIESESATDDTPKESFTDKVKDFFLGYF